MTKLGVVGGGTMGSGIVQIAAQQGMNVVLWDVRRDVVEASVTRIRGFLERNVERGRMRAADVDATLARITATTDFAAMADVDCVIEAAVEDLAVKQDVFRNLDQHCQPRAVLATNTSSLSVTEIAAATGRPEAVVGMHFFNPVPLMALVEVVRAGQTSVDTVDRALGVARELGKTPVRAEDTPGFIVNRIVRPFYNEALRILNDGQAPLETIDRIMKGHGFRMGPFELMDLIGNDVNLAVTATIFDQLFGEPRFRPSFQQRRVVQSGYLGQKTGHGWYPYGGVGGQATGVRDSGTTDTAASQQIRTTCVVIADSAAGGDLARALAVGGHDVRLYMADGAPFDAGPVRIVHSLADAVDGADLVVDALTSPVDRKRELLRRADAVLLPGRAIISLALTISSTEIASWCGDPTRVCGFGYLPPVADAKVIEIAPALQTGERATGAAVALAASLGKEPVVVGDGAGLIAARVVALIANEAAQALMEGIATADDIDTAVRLGANYPHGPLEWADLVGLDLLYAIIKGMQEEFGEDRYRPSPLLRKMVAAGWTGRSVGRGFHRYEA
ncbi:MAG: 3-hydroxybutyryl-CoA dehydrogenase [Chloroflexi bacterium]|nr:3-hydroxybutyryl-CoA dehydrogenase [Chloroflexota bacterium]